MTIKNTAQSRYVDVIGPNGTRQKVDTQGPVPQPSNDRWKDVPAVQPEPEQEEQVMQFEPAHISAPRPNQPNPQVKSVQTFLNKNLGGQQTLIKEDGLFGPETQKALSMWGQQNNMAGVNPSALFQAALRSAITPLQTPGPEYQAAKTSKYRKLLNAIDKYASIIANL